MGKKGLRLVEADDAVPLTGAQVYREAALFTARFLRSRMGELPDSDVMYGEIARDVRRLELLAQCADTRGRTPDRASRPRDLAGLPYRQTPDGSPSLPGRALGASS